VFRETKRGKMRSHNERMGRVTQRQPEVTRSSKLHFTFRNEFFSY